MTITPSVDDAPAFVEAVRALTVGLLCTYAPPSVIVIKIDNFFGWRWLRFSGKWLGLLSIRNKKLNVPPFAPNRVVSQKTFIGPTYDEASIGEPIHIKTEGRNGLRRYIADVAHDALVVWYSGNSNSSGQGALMAYVPNADDYWPIYVRWAKRDSWRVVEAIEITAQVVERLSRPESVPGAVQFACEPPTT